MTHWEYELTFTLAAGYDDDDAAELLDYIEEHKSVSGAAMSASYRQAAVPLSDAYPAYKKIEAITGEFMPTDTARG